MSLLAAGVIGSAFCLFLVQPMMAKRLLPVFGGSAAVWAVCLVFYQVMLLLGYLYAHGLARRLAPRMQAVVHAGLCGLALLALPLVTAAPGGGGADSPSGAIVTQLGLAIGLPYLLLSATSPLLQHWHALLYPGQRAYRLFAWSNLSCVVALLAFPFWLEPRFGWGGIAGFWKVAFGVAVGLHLLSALVVWRKHPAEARREAVAGEAEGVAAREPWIWLFLAFLGSGLLVSVTDHLCLIVAPFPMLWVVPLLLYLLSFVVVFEADRYRRAWGVPAGFAGLLAMAWAMTYLPPARMLGVGVVVFSLGLFAVCVMVHGELAQRRPAERHLTTFYIVMATGGALGSVFVALIAPQLFRHTIEMPLFLALTALTALFLVYRRTKWGDAPAAAAAVLVAAAAGAQWLVLEQDVVAAGRNFYGALRVTEKEAAGGRGRVRTIVHGAVNHGAQAMTEERRRTPLAYYTPNTGVGLLLGREETEPRRVGLVGLGAGALAAYGRAGDVFRFYEINPLVVEMATKHFTYLSDSPARVEVVLGDARLELAKEADLGLDVLVVDAFTGDSVPVHLLTREAMEIYGRHVKADGVIALHLSNLHLDLTRVALALGRDMGWRAAVLSTPANEELDSVGAVWVLMDRKPDEPPAAVPDPRLLWTDDSSSLLPILR